MWYSDSYRRHLCDMHIDDWDDSFLRDFSPEAYVENLKKASVQNAMLYMQSHAGLCYYPTKIGVMHRAFRGREDMMKRTMALCHDNGITVTGYYSLNYNTREHDRHPTWRMVQANGLSRRENGGDISSSAQVRAFASLQDGRYGLCCPNNFEYRDFVYRQIDEMLAYFEVDGVFFDMPFWPHTCFCSSCRARWEREEGTPFPTEEPQVGSSIHLPLMRKKYEWMGDWVASVTDYVKKCNPDLSVEYNFAEGIAGSSNSACGEPVNAASDFVGGDLYGGILNHSLACKFYKNITRNQPFDYMFSRCKPALRSHTLTKTEDEMLAEVLLTTAHHGATMVIDAIDPVGTTDARVYERIGKVFAVEKSYEPYLSGEMREDVGLYYSMRSRFASSIDGFDCKDACIGASKKLIAAHVPFGVTGPYADLDRYRALIVPMVSEAEMADNERILAYIANGGCAYVSGARNGALVAALTGGMVSGKTVEKSVYIAPCTAHEEIFGGFNAKYPLPFDACAPILENVQNGEVIAKLTLPYTRPDEIRFASIHSDPPGIAMDNPAVIVGSYGKGRFVWSALPLEAIDLYEYEIAFGNLLKILTEKDAPSFVTDAPADVEITVFDDRDAITVNVIHLNERAQMPVLPPFEIGVRSAKAPCAVELLPCGERIPFSFESGYVRFSTKHMHVFDMYRILL